jgi:hypothetical protein
LEDNAVSSISAVKMISVSVVYGSALVLLGCWATFTTFKTLASHGGWTEHRALVGVGAVFVASCFLPGIALLAGPFEPWMLIPLGVCYVVLIPFPCYFEWANRGWIRPGRTILFLLVGAALVAAGIGWLPASWYGL